MKKKICLKILIALLLFFGYTKAEVKQPKEKTRVVVMTDGEKDDRSSMIRFLLYTTDIELLAIIETNSVYQQEGHSNDDWCEKQLNAYGQVYPNLIKHNLNYPTLDYLKKISFVGDEDYNHLYNFVKGTHAEYRKPGGKVAYKPDDWSDTPGSDRIVEILLEENPAPVHIQAWGGGNTAARAFYKLKKDYPDEYKRAVSKAVMYNVIYQDGAGTYIEKYHPNVTMIFCGSFSGTWNYNSQKNTYDFIEKHVKNNHGPLGALYPQDYVSEGDSPAFLYVIANGLRNCENPTYGGWGGRFEKMVGPESVYKHAVDDGDKGKSLRIWIDDANRNFQARMDWCVFEHYQDANHAPVAIVKGEKDIVVKSGGKVRLNASKSFDPDKDDIGFSWWQYKSAGSYDGLVEIKNSEQAKSSIIVPEVSQPKTIHIILKVSDDGSPVLDSYQRIIITILP